MYFSIALMVIVQVALAIFPESVHGSGHRDGHAGMRSIEKYAMKFCLRMDTRNAKNDDFLSKKTISHICQFLYTAALFRLVKNTTKCVISRQNSQN